MSNDSFFTNIIKPGMKDLRDNKDTYTDKVVQSFKRLYHTDVNVSFLSGIYRNKNYIAALEIVQYLVFIVLIYYFNPFNIKNKYPNFAAIISMLVAFLYVMFFYFLRSKIDIEKLAEVNTVKPTESDFFKQLGATFGYFLLFMLIIKGLVWVFFNTSGANLVRLTISFFFVVCLLGIVYVLLEPMLKKAARSSSGGKPSLLSFVYKIIMYMPCLLLVFLDYMKRQFNITTPLVWMLLALEGCIVALYVLVPRGLKYMATLNGIQLLNEPVYLNEDHTVGTFEELYIKARKISPDEKHVVLFDAGGNDLTQSRTFKYSYGLSFWFYINPQGSNTSSAYGQYTPLFSYGNKPRVEYNFRLNTLRVMTETGQSEDSVSRSNVLQELFSTKDVLFQKWNQMAINYNGGTMDIFLNGELVGSKTGISPYMSYESITLGHKNGIAGGIANVMYYNNPLSSGTIKVMYKLLRDKTFPIL
jgi:hypothetical protein